MRKPEQAAVKRVEETSEEGQNRLLSRVAKKHIASENVSCGYFTLLVQHEFAGGLADRCAEETGEEVQNRLLSRGAKKHVASETCHVDISRYSSSMNSPGVLPTDVRKKRVKKE